MASTLTRIVTCHRQWRHIGCWLGRDDLFQPGVEWIVVNDDPNEPCPEDLARRLEARRMSMVGAPFNLGRSAARNLGAQRAGTPWIEHIDGDDLPLPLDPGLLPDPAGADVVQFPAVETFRAIGELANLSGFLGEREAQANWDAVIPHLRPFDVRLTANAWRRDFFLAIGGYDGRFEGFEDVQLAFKASLSRARVARRRRPKQVYCRRRQADARTRTRIEGSRRFLLWVKAEQPASLSPEMQGWLAKDQAYLMLRSIGEFAANPAGIARYLRWRYFGGWRG